MVTNVPGGGGAIAFGFGGRARWPPCWQSAQRRQAVEAPARAALTRALAERGVLRGRA
jgi:hypothetical protein